MTLEMRIRCLCKRILPTRPTAALQRLAGSAARTEPLYSVQCKCGRYALIYAGDVQDARTILDAERLSA